jgi:NADH-quinone oxidoreductase subunit C
VTGPAADLGRELADAVGGEVEEAFGVVTVDVPRDRWPDALDASRGRGLTFFDWLSAVDELDAGVSVVCHVADPGSLAHLLLRTRLPLDDLSVATATHVYRGASWHERETAEMFGVDFVGHPYLVPLLLPDGFEGRPLRKEFVLAARAVKAWPGAKEPGESDHDAPARRRTLPPGVPDPQTWGPRSADAAAAQPADDEPADKPADEPADEPGDAP